MKIIYFLFIFLFESFLIHLPLLFLFNFRFFILLHFLNCQIYLLKNINAIASSYEITNHRSPSQFLPSWSRQT